MVLALRSVTVRRQAAAAAEALPELARRAVADLLEQLHLLDERIQGYDKEIEAQARLSEPARRLLKDTRGIGPTTALAIVATVGNAREFKNGRRLRRLDRPGARAISQPAARRALVISANAVMPIFATCSCRVPARCCTARSTPGPHVALGPRAPAAPRLLRTLVAIANKNARIAWALLARDQELQAI